LENGEKPGENPKKIRKTIENLGNPQEKTILNRKTQENQGKWNDNSN
jgi:hypothetical protein